jgi:pyruvate/2-oxoglutarate dehydrogenase complex dihydrolipoamide acyltransferase (E2) component
VPKFIQGDLFGDVPPKQPPAAEPAKQPDPTPVPVAPTQPATEASKLPASTERTFLGWEQPLLDTAAEHLLRNHAGQRLIDLSDLLVVVPTQNAGRRLREALATSADQSDGAVIPPMVVPPEFLISPTNARPADATPVAGTCSRLILSSARSTGPSRPPAIS